VEEAKKRLETLKQPIPAADPAAYERMKYDMEAMRKPGMIKRTTGFLSARPDPYTAAKSGAPSMAGIKPPTPVSVPTVAAADAIPGGPVNGIGGGEVTATTVTDKSALDSKPNELGGGAAKEGAAKEGAASATPGATSPSGTATADSARTAIKGPLPTNYQETDKQRKKRLKMMEKLTKKRQQQIPKAEVTGPAPGDKTAAPDSTTAAPPKP
jgi:hypothetical protein